MQRILLFSDLHGDTKAAERLMAIDADLYIAAGDLSTFARNLDKMGPILGQKADRVYVMPGNHESAADVERFTAQWGLQYFHHRSISVGRYTVAGLGYSNITPFRTPGEYTEEALEQALAPWADLKPLVLVCHCPPKDTPLDQAGVGKHFGSPAIRRFVDAHQPEWFFCGHIHEAEGVDATLGTTRGRNVGKRGYLLELE